MIKSIKKRWGLALSLAFYVFIVMFAATALTLLVIIILDVTGLLTIFSNLRLENEPYRNPFHRTFMMMALSIFLGIIIAGFFSKKALKPIRNLIAATHKVAAGDFSIRVELKGINELEELSESFNKMTHELSSIETLRRDFINNFSHEFKTPIVSILGFAKLLKDSELSAKEKQEYIDIIIAESDRLAHLSTNILNLSKYENIEIIANKIPFRLDEQIRRAIVLTEPKWSAKELVFNIEMDEILFEGDEDLTQQVWINLLDNAIKFSNQNGIINVRLDYWNGRIRFTIQDNGIGMNEETSVHIFEKFYQGEISRNKAGNGLGLAIIKRIIELHSGQIEVQSELGKGSTFVIFLSPISLSILTTPKGEPLM